MANDTTFVLAQDPAQMPPKDSRRLNPDEIAAPEVPQAPALVASRPQNLPGRRPLFRS